MFSSFYGPVPGLVTIVQFHHISDQTNYQLVVCNSHKDGTAICKEGPQLVMCCETHVN